MQVGMNFGHVKKLWSHQTLHEWTPFVEMMRSFQPITTKLERLIGKVIFILVPFYDSFPYLEFMRVM